MDPMPAGGLDRERGTQTRPAHILGEGERTEVLCGGEQQGTDDVRGKKCRKTSDGRRGTKKQPLECRRIWKKIRDRELRAMGARGPGELFVMSKKRRDLGRSGF